MAHVQYKNNFKFDFYMTNPVLIITVRFVKNVLNNYRDQKNILNN